MDSIIDLLKYNLNNNSNNLIDLSLNNGFLNIISKATRIQNNSSSLIDQIFFNKNPDSLTSEVIVSNISDHFLTFTINSSKLIKPTSHSYRDFPKKIRIDLKTIYQF